MRVSETLRFLMMGLRSGGLTPARHSTPAISTNSCTWPTSLAFT